MELNKKKSGFTLIELLVVIAIIGLLSSIVLAAMNSAKLKAQDARVKGDLANLRSAAEMYRVQNGDVYFPSIKSWSPVFESYCGGSFINDNINGGSKIVNDLASTTGVNNPNSPEKSDVFCGLAPASYYFSVRLPSDPNSYICVDSSGTLRNETAFWGYRFGSGTTDDPYKCP